MNTGVSYRGKVSIKIKNKPPIKKYNSGTPHLFNILCRALAQDPSISEGSFPSYISLIHNNNNDINGDVRVTQKSLESNSLYENYKEYKIILHEIPITKRDIESDGTLMLSCLLNYSNINTDVYESLKTDLSDLASDAFVLLLDGKKEKILAYVDFKVVDIDPVYADPSGQAVIDWRMTFDNIDGGE